MSTFAVSICTLSWRKTILPLVGKAFGTILPCLERGRMCISPLNANDRKYGNDKNTKITRQRKYIDLQQ